MLLAEDRIRVGVSVYQQVRVRSCDILDHEAVCLIEPDVESPSVFDLR